MKPTLFGRQTENIRPITSGRIVVPFTVQGVPVGQSVVSFPADNSGGFLSNLNQALSFASNQPVTDFGQADVGQMSLRTIRMCYLTALFRDVFLRSFQVSTNQPEFSMREMKVFNACNDTGTVQVVYQQSLGPLIVPEQPNIGTLIASDPICNVEMLPGIAIAFDILQGEILSGFFEFTLGSAR